MVFGVTQSALRSRTAIVPPGGGGGGAGVSVPGGGGAVGLVSSTHVFVALSHTHSSTQGHCRPARSIEPTPQATIATTKKKENRGLIRISDEG
jgi:acyl CoA:acetate/3-ketoacid CoA transferase beta subunit